MATFNTGWLIFILEEIILKKSQINNYEISLNKKKQISYK